MILWDILFSFQCVSFQISVSQYYFAEGRARRVARHVASGTRYELRAAGPGRAGAGRGGPGRAGPVAAAAGRQPSVAEATVATMSLTRTKLNWSAGVVLFL